MKTDKELLELAAKAAGVLLFVDDYDQREGYYKRRINWYPLTDDGDALRLVVKLGMTVSPFPAGARVRYQNHILDTCEVEVFGEDPAAATRRAIVRAAAAIGEMNKLQ